MLIIRPREITFVLFIQWVFVKCPFCALSMLSASWNSLQSKSYTWHCNSTSLLLWNLPFLVQIPSLIHCTSKGTASFDFVINYSFLYSNACAAVNWKDFEDHTPMCESQSLYLYCLYTWIGLWHSLNLFREPGMPHLQ